MAISMYDLVNRIQNLCVPSNSIFVSFDVTNLYTCVPLSPTLLNISDILSKSGLIPPIIDEFIDLLKVCIDHNVCKFDHEFYLFPDGLPMRSPLAPLLAEIFMNSLENDIFNSNNPLVSCIYYWYLSLIHI